MCGFPKFFEVQGLDGKKYLKNSTPKGSWEKIFVLFFSIFCCSLWFQSCFILNITWGDPIQFDYSHMFQMG